MKRSVLGLVDRIVIGVSMARARYRSIFGFCPICNSDAPELYDCPLCGGYHSVRGDTWPPPAKLRSQWLEEYRRVCVTQRNIKRLVREARARRLSR